MGSSNSTWSLCAGLGGTTYLTQTVECSRAPMLEQMLENDAIAL